MKDELLKSAKDLINGKIKFLDYHNRNNIERSLFHIMKSFMLEKLGYHLGGLSYPHKFELEKFLKENEIEQDDIEVIKEGFEIYYILTSTSSSDPYTRFDIKDILGNEDDELILFGKKIIRYLEMI